MGPQRAGASPRCGPPLRIWANTPLFSSSPAVATPTPPPPPLRRQPGARHPPKAGAWGIRSPPRGSSSGGADAQRLRGGTWPAFWSSAYRGGAERLQLAAACPEWAEVLGAAARPGSPSRQNPQRGISAVCFPVFSGQTAGRKRPLFSGPGAAEHRGARPRGGENRGSSVGPGSRGCGSANLRALTRGAAPRRSDI